MLRLNTAALTLAFILIIPISGRVFGQSFFAPAAFDFTVKLIPTNKSVGNNAIEGCNDIVVAFILAAPAPTEMGIGFTIGGSAVMGEDYTAIPDFVNFLTGQDSAAVVIHPLSDGIAEGGETVTFPISQVASKGVADSMYTVIIVDQSILSVDVGKDITSCPGEINRFDAHVEGGYAPFTYTWNTGQENESFITVILSQGSSMYIVSVEDQCDATDADSVVLSIDSTALLTNDPAEKAICSGDSSAILLTSNITRAAFAWQPEDISNNISGYSQGSDSLINQKLSLKNAITSTLNYHVNISASGCAPSDQVFAVTVNPLPALELGEPAFVEPSAGIILHAGGGFKEYLWSDLSTDSVLLVDKGGQYQVTVTDYNGCSSSDSVMVFEFGTRFPNAFTPNGDGLNDKFRIAGFEEQSFTLMQIFNRWGNLVFETKNLDEGWDGTCNNQPCPAGTYVWVIRFKLSKEKIYKGTVDILK